MGSKKRSWRDGVLEIEQMTEEEKKRIQQELAKKAAELVMKGAGTATDHLKKKWQERQHANRPVNGAVIDGPQEVDVSVKIILFRPESGNEISVFMDDLRFVKIGGYQYFCAWVTPGKHTFFSEHKKKFVEFEFVLGTCYYLTLESSTWAGKLQVELADAAKYRKHCNSLSPVKAKQVTEREGIRFRE